MTTEPFPVNFTFSFNESNITFLEIVKFVLSIEKKVKSISKGARVMPCQMGRL